jgi:hypothetical protein
MKRQEDTTMNAQSLIAIGTIVVVHNMGQTTFGMVADHKNDKWGWRHVVLVGGKFEEIYHIGDVNMKGIGWKIASKNEIAFRNI